jgi:prepilin-type N-terminal cleavage/methylation domain-containing protein
MKLHKDQRGFTLIELLIALPIAALIVAAATGAIIQVIHSNQASSRMFAVRQVQTAGFWVSQDGLQAQSVTISESNGFLLVLEWTDWETGDAYQITYSLQDMPSGELKQLQRTEKVKPKGATEYTETATTVAEYIVGSETSCSWTNVKKEAFTFKVTATVGGRTEARTYEITPRVLS